MSRITKNRVKEEILMVPISDFLIEKLLGFQIAHVQNLIYAIQKNGLAVDMSDTGTGKTYCGCSIAKQLNLNLLVIGPKSVIPNWYRTAEEFGVELLGVVNYETIKNGKYYSDLRDFENEAREDCPYIEIIRVDKTDPITGEFVLTNSGKPQKIIQNIIWKLPRDTLVIFDEAHRGKNGLCSMRTSINSQLIVSIKPYLKINRCIYGLFLSATITDKMEHFDVLSYLFGFYRPYLSKSYKAFLKTLGPEEGVMQKIHQLIFPLRGSRMRIDQMPPGIFKQNDVLAETYLVSNEIAQAIEDHHRNIELAMTNLRAKGESQGLGYIMRCRQQIELLKIPTVANEAIRYLKEGKSVVIFINFNETKNLLSEKILEATINDEQPLIMQDLDNMNSLSDFNSSSSTTTNFTSTRKLITDAQLDYIHGLQTGEERQKVITRFQKDEIYCLICNIKAGGVGISLHDINGARQRVSLIFPTWSAIELKQAMGRIYRAYAKSDAIQRIVHCKSIEKITKKQNDNAYLTIEERICASVNEKLQNIELLNDDALNNIMLL